MKLASKLGTVGYPYPILIEMRDDPRRVRRNVRRMKRAGKLTDCDGALQAWLRSPAAQRKTAVRP